MSAARLLVRLVVLGLILVGGACAPPEQGVGAGALDDSIECATNVVHVNTQGGTYTATDPMNDDPVTGQSSVLGGLDSGEGRVGPALDASRRASLLGCLVEVFAAYRVSFTAVRPDPACEYREVVVGLPDEAMRDWMGDAAGRAPNPFNCWPTPTGIAFVEVEAADEMRTRGLDPLCAVVAHEVGHLFGLRHVQSAEWEVDLMEQYLNGKIVRGFRDTEERCLGCERDWPNPNARYDCREDELQNSHRRLLQVIGPGGDPEPAAGD